MDFSITTPALLFPTVSLLLLAYTNRFLALASLVRDLKSEYQTKHHTKIIEQINNLSRRIKLIRNMQAFGIASLFLCVLSMFALFTGNELIARNIFGTSLVLLMISLGTSLWEIQLSLGALSIELSDVKYKKT